MDLSKFLLALMSDWISLMSGIASVILTIVGIAWKWTSVPRWVFWLTASLCFFFASARVWTTEHRRADELNAALDRKQGTNVSLRMNFYGMKPGGPSIFVPETQVRADIAFVDDGPYRASDFSGAAALVILDSNSKEDEDKAFSDFIANKGQPRSVIDLNINGSPSFGTYQTQTLSETDVADLINFRKALYVFAFAEWTDPAGKNELESCSRLQEPGNTPVSHPCVHHNKSRVVDRLVGR